jgi:hypothetical protein
MRRGYPTDTDERRETITDGGKGFSVVEDGQ